MADEGGGIRQYIRFVVDKSGLATLKADAKEMGEKAAQEIVYALASGKITSAIRDFGGRTLGSIKDLGVNIGKQLSMGFQLAGPQIQQSGKRVVKAYVDDWKQGIASVKNALAIVKIPEPAAISPGSRKNLMKQYGKDTDEFRAAVLRMQIATQVAGTRLGPFGNLLQKVGVNAYQSSPKLQGLIQQIRSSGAAAQGTKGVLSGFNMSLGSLGTSVLKLVKQFGLLASAYKIISFLRSSAIAAGENQAAWAKLSSTLADYGIRLSQVQPEVLKLSQANLALGIKEGDTVEIVARLTQLTGDYGKSIKGTAVVMDLMATSGMGLEQASRAVGRAIEGDYLALSRMGIYLDKSRDALEQLSERMGGEAKAKAATFAGQITIAAAAMDQLHVAIGNALVSPESGAGNPMQTWIDFLKEMKSIVLENKDTFQLLGGTLNVILMVTLPLIKALFVGIGGAIKLAETMLGSFYIGIKAVPIAAEIAFNRVAQYANEMAAHLENVWNKVFKTSHDGFAKMAKDAKAAADAASKRNEELGQNADRGLMSIWLPPSEAAKAPDQQLGNTAKVRGREDQVLDAKIRELGQVMMGKNPVFSADAQRQLTEILSQQEQRLQELNASDESRVKNAGAILDVEKHIVDVKGIQAKFEKQQLDAAGQRQTDAARMSEIERLGRITREGASKDQLHASTQLRALEKEITAERGKQARYGERYWVLTGQIDGIQRQQQETAHAQDLVFTKGVKDLSDRVRLHVAEGEAMQELRTMQQSLNAEYDKALKIKNLAQRLDALRVIAARQALVDQAMLVPLDEKEKRINEDINRLKDPALRNLAERDLLKLRSELIRMEESRKALGMDVIREEQMVLDINRAILETKELDLKVVRAEVRDADKAAKHFDTRKAALKIYQDQLEKINTELARSDISVERRHDDEAIKQDLERKMRAVKEPVNTLYKDIGETFKDALPDMIEQGAGRATDAWVNGFGLIIKSSKDAKKNIQESFRGIGKAYAAEISQVAKVKVKEHIAASVGELAKAAGNIAIGNWGAAAKNAESAGLHILSAAKWGLIAGAAANASGSSGGGSGGSGRNTNGTAAKATPVGPSIYIRVDGIDPTNPRHQELAGETLQQYYQRTGGQLFTSAG